jgi:hypothetical protein
VKVFAIPTTTSGLTAALSVLFFVGLSRVYGDTMLGQIILVQAAVALVQVALVPSSWVYLLGGTGEADLARKYSEGQLVEWAGISAGALMVAAGSAVIGERAAGAIPLFLSLAIGASSSCLGYLRATGRWRLYFLWVLTPNLIRVPLVWATPALVAAGVLPDPMGSRTAIAIGYFLVPDLARLGAIYVPIAAAHFAWPGVARTARAARRILRNWLFDLGSAVTDQADKLIVGAVVGSQVLVAYFFARRMVIVTVMVTEPMYWEFYRRRAADIARIGLADTWFRGLASAVLLWSAMAAIISLAIRTPLVGVYIPNAIVSMIGMFLAVMLLDGLFAANRWSRYLAQASDRSVQLLVVRLAVFGVFAVTLALLAPIFPIWAVVVAMLAALGCEAAYVARLAQKATSA